LVLFEDLEHQLSIVVEAKCNRLQHHCFVLLVGLLLAEQVLELSEEHVHEAWKITINLTLQVFKHCHNDFQDGDAVKLSVIFLVVDQALLHKFESQVKVAARLCLVVAEESRDILRNEVLDAGHYGSQIFVPISTIDVAILASNDIKHLREHFPQIRCNRFSVIHCDSSNIKTILNGIDTVNRETVHNNWENDLDEL